MVLRQFSAVGVWTFSERDTLIVGEEQTGQSHTGTIPVTRTTWKNTRISYIWRVVIFIYGEDTPDYSSSFIYCLKCYRSFRAGSSGGGAKSVTAGRCGLVAGLEFFVGLLSASWDHILDFLGDVGDQITGMDTYNNNSNCCMNAVVSRYDMLEGFQGQEAGGCTAGSDGDWVKKSILFFFFLLLARARVCVFFVCYVFVFAFLNYLEGYGGQ